MPPSNFVNLTVSKDHAERLHRLRVHISKNGYESTPEEFRPPDHDSITAGTIIEMALRGLEHACKLKALRTSREPKKAEKAR